MPIVLQNYFEPWTKERSSKLISEQRFLIQENTVSHSIIAHFETSASHWPILQHHLPISDISLTATTFSGLLLILS
jgi:hypothetical protein